MIAPPQQKKSRSPSIGIAKVIRQVMTETRDELTPNHVFSSAALVMYWICPLFFRQILYAQFFYIGFPDLLWQPCRRSFWFFNRNSLAPEYMDFLRSLLSQSDLSDAPGSCLKCCLSWRSSRKDPHLLSLLISEGEISLIAHEYPHIVLWSFRIWLCDINFSLKLSFLIPI